MKGSEVTSCSLYNEASSIPNKNVLNPVCKLSTVNMTLPHHSPLLGSSCTSFTSPLHGGDMYTYRGPTFPQNGCGQQTTSVHHLSPSLKMAAESGVAKGTEGTCPRAIISAYSYY